MEDVTFRPFGDGDSIDGLTDLLHRAYSPHAAAGRRFFASYQSADDTRARIARGECWLALRGDAPLGSVTIVPHYRPPAGYPVMTPAGSFSQLAVLPDHAGAGLGTRLLELAEHRLGELGQTAVVIDTSSLATDLLAWYHRRGYVTVGTWRWSVTNYESAVMYKTLG